ncbi:MAG: hypothetical protein M3R66_19305 [Actinomycetota bacterium]|nr:hypothetical protein [Actinomycetota bacterium]
MPAFGPEAAHAKMAVFAGKVPTDAQASAWQAAQKTFRRFDAADQYLFSVPMWNTGGHAGKTFLVQVPPIEGDRHDQDH